MTGSVLDFVLNKFYVVLDSGLFNKTSLENFKEISETYRTSDDDFMENSLSSRFW